MDDQFNTPEGASDSFNSPLSTRHRRDLNEYHREQYGRRSSKPNLDEVVKARLQDLQPSIPLSLNYFRDTLEAIEQTWQAVIGIEAGPPHPGGRSIKYWPYMGFKDNPMKETTDATDALRLVFRSMLDVPTLESLNAITATYSNLTQDELASPPDVMANHIDMPLVATQLLQACIDWKHWLELAGGGDATNIDYLNFRANAACVQFLNSFDEILSLCNTTRWSQNTGAHADLKRAIQIAGVETHWVKKPKIVVSFVLKSIGSVDDIADLETEIAKARNMHAMVEGFGIGVLIMAPKEMLESPTFADPGHVGRWKKLWDIVEANFLSFPQIAQRLTAYVAQPILTGGTCLIGVVDVSKSDKSMLDRLTAAHQEGAGTNDDGEEEAE